MSSPSLHRRPGEGAEVAHHKDAEREHRPSSVRITVIVQNRYTFDTELITGRQIKEAANISAGFALYRRVQGGNKPISEDAMVELHDGDRFFARPSSSAT
jgi:hypothetical protein